MFLFISLTLVPHYGTLAGQCARGLMSGIPEKALTRGEILDEINRAIREHELRVALWSGLLGALLMAGTWHAILLCRP
jgi:hypothetical protein